MRFRFPSLSNTDLEDLLKRTWVAKLATIRPDGAPRITCLSYEYRKDHIVMNTWESTEAVRNLKRNNKASLCVDASDPPFKGVNFFGVGTVDERASTVTEIGEFLTRYVGNVEAATKYAESLMAAGNRVFIHFYPEQKVTWDSTRMAPASR